MCILLCSCRALHEVAAHGGVSVDRDMPSSTPPMSISVGSQDEDSIFPKEERGRTTPTSDPVVYTWGGCTSLPIKLHPPVKETNAKVVGVACGRNQRAGMTKDGKLFFWKVRV